jgi:hypothetical protein
MEASDDRIEREIMRQAMLQAARNQPPYQYLPFQNATALVLEGRGFPVQANLGGPGLRPQDLRRFREILWSLIGQGILVQGYNEANDNWPFLGITEWGEEYLAAEPTPDIYDPDGYLRALSASAPLDDVETRFLSQAVGAFRADLPDACAVMLGVASEHLLLKLFATVSAADSAAGGKKKTLPTSALTLLKYLHGNLAARKSALPPELQDDIETTFLGIGGLVRSTRNDSGHPRGGSTSREQAATNLRLFAHYRKWVTSAAASIGPASSQL